MQLKHVRCKRIYYFLALMKPPVTRTRTPKQLRDFLKSKVYEDFDKIVDGFVFDRVHRLGKKMELSYTSKTNSGKIREI